MGSPPQTLRLKPWLTDAPPHLDVGVIKEEDNIEMVVETEVLVSEDISTEVQQVEPSPTPCLVTWGRLTITKTPVFRDNTEERDRSTGKEESRFDGKSARGERSTEDLYKRKILEKRTLEESLSRGEIFCGKKSKVTIE